MYLFEEMISFSSQNYNLRRIMQCNKIYVAKKRYRINIIRLLMSKIVHLNLSKLICIIFGLAFCAVIYRQRMLNDELTLQLAKYSKGIYLLRIEKAFNIIEQLYRTQTEHTVDRRVSSVGL